MPQEQAEGRVHSLSPRRRPVTALDWNSYSDQRGNATTAVFLRRPYTTNVLQDTARHHGCGVKSLSVGSRLQWAHARSAALSLSNASSLQLADVIRVR
jgi:hypothetical protein